MANKKSAKKRAKQNLKKRAHNKSLRSGVRSNLKTHVAKLAAAQSLDEKKTIFSLIQSLLHKAGKKGTFPALRMDRKLGRLASKYLNG